MIHIVYTYICVPTQGAGVYVYNNRILCQNANLTLFY